MSVVVAVDELERIPNEIAIHVMGVQYIVNISTRNWLREPLYAASDMPKPKEKFSKPSLEDRHRHPTKPEPFAISRRVLIEMCKGRELNSLPTEVQEVLALIPEIEKLLREDN